MHAVVVKVSIEDVDRAVSSLNERVVPGISGAPGFVAGYWTRKGNSGLAMTVFESEEAAKGASEQVRSAPTDGVTIDDVEVREVVAHA